MYSDENFKFKVLTSSSSTTDSEDVSETTAHMSQVCNETDAQLIISKYKKNTMKRKKKSFIQK